MSDVFIAKDMFGEETIRISEGFNGDVFIARVKYENIHDVIAVKRESLIEWVEKTNKGGDKVNKPIIVEIDNIRIRRWDEHNVAVERKETYFSAKDKKYISNYRFKGYYANVYKALLAVYTNWLLVDESNINIENEKEFVKMMKETRNKILKAIEQVQEGQKQILDTIETTKEVAAKK